MSNLFCKLKIKRLQVQSALKKSKLYLEVPTLLNGG